jgi:NAD(P)-dependent dehydrogenase (short-subunit alcohol dehydrogenase family)
MKNKIESKKGVAVITGRSRGIGFEASLIHKYSLVVVHIGHAAAC